MLIADADAGVGVVVVGGGVAGDGDGGGGGVVKVVMQWEVKSHILTMLKWALKSQPTAIGCKKLSHAGAGT
eukprot:4042892-Lingulodinium_polyedra.AAC.1